MSLPRLRLESCTNLDGVWLIDGAQAHHLVRVRRCCSGSIVEGLLDGEKIELRLLCEDAAVRAVEISRESEAVMLPEIHLLLGLLKNDQFDDALRFAAETGVHSIHLISCQHSVSRYSGTKLDEKLLRWRKILDEATKQAGSTRPPILYAPCDLDKLDFSILPDCRFAAILSPDAAEIRYLKFESRLTVAIGPEGDWSKSEIKIFKDKGFIAISLGKRILRASTAVAAACSWFMLRQTFL